MFTQTTLPLMAGLLFIPITSFADDTAADLNTFSMGIAGQYAPRYSGSNQQFFQVFPVIQGRKGAFFVDSEKGLGYDLQADNGLYLEHTLGYSLGRSERNSNWREGANELKGMGNIKAAMNTALAVGWSIAPWVNIEGKAILPVTDSQGWRIRLPLRLFLCRMTLILLHCRTRPCSAIVDICKLIMASVKNRANARDMKPLPWRRFVRNKHKPDVEPSN
jgi:hypothetical protein